MYSDDIDLSYMVLQKGKQNYYFHETTVIHYKGESTIKDETYMKRFQEAMHFFYKKHFRVSFFFDFFMNIGVFFFALFKKSQAVTTKRKIDDYFLFSEDKNLILKVENLLGNKVFPANSTFINTLNSLLNRKDKNIELIFDQSEISFKTIIKNFENYKNSHLRLFRKTQIL